MNKVTKDKQIIKNDEIDLVKLYRFFRAKRKFVIRTTILFMIAGVIIAFLLPNQFTAFSKMVPQISGESSKTGRLSSLASMAGIDFSLSNETYDLMPQVYPQIVSSTPFLLQIMEDEYYIRDIPHKITLYEYYTEYSNSLIFSIIKKYILELPGKVIKWLTGDKYQVSLRNVNESTLVLTKEQEEIIKIISGNISLDVNDKDGYIELKSCFHEPWLAAQVARKAQELLQEYITEFKIKKAAARLNFIEERYQDKKKEFEQAQALLADFRDRNRNVTSARALTEMETLQNEYQLAFEVYSDIARQLEQARIKVKEDTPVFAVIQPVVVPNKKSKPKRMLIVGITGIIGLAISVIWCFRLN